MKDRMLTKIVWVESNPFMDRKPVFQIPVRKPDETGWRGWMWIFLARFRVDQREIHHLAAVIPVQFPNSLDEFPIGFVWK